MDKDCCKIEGSLCGMRGSHHTRNCECTGCLPTTRIVDRINLASMAAVVDWAESLDPKGLREFGHIVAAF